MKYRPLNKIILVEVPAEANKGPDGLMNIGGIIIPEDAQNAQRAIREQELGSMRELPVFAAALDSTPQEGDIVVFNYIGAPILSLFGREYYYLNDQQIICYVRKEDAELAKKNPAVG